MDSLKTITQAANECADMISFFAMRYARFMTDLAHSAKLPPNSPESSPQFPDLTVFCRARDFFNHSSYTIRECLPASALQYFWLLDIEEPVSLFQVPSLNLAASYLRQYLRTRETHDWFHVIVKAISFPSFVTALDRDRGNTRILRFSCWCDGGPETEDLYRQHRHLIVISPRGHFEAQVWRTVQVFYSIPCKAFKMIDSPIHLLYLLGYLSRRMSRCEFTLRSNKLFRATPNHFFIFETLPRDYRKSLAAQWDGGLLELLYRERLWQASVSQLAETPLVLENAQWKQKIGDFYNLERKVVLPVIQEFSPTDQETPYFVFTTRGRKLYFQWDWENKQLSREAWLQKQVNGGNSFYDALEEDWWIPKLMEQKQLHDLIPRIQRIKALEHMNNYLKEKLAHFTKENEESELLKKKKKIFFFF